MSIEPTNNKQQIIDISNPIELIQEANDLEEEASPTKLRHRKEEDIDTKNILRKNLADSFKKKSNFLTLQGSNQKFLNKTSRILTRGKLFPETPRINPHDLLVSSRSKLSQAYHVGPVLSPRRPPPQPSFRDSFPKSTHNYQ